MSSRRRQQSQPQRTDLEWDFWSFPTYYAFAIGGLVAVLLFAFLPLPVFVIFLFATSFGTAHAISHRWRRRVTDKHRLRDQEDERERRALMARSAASLENEQASRRRRRKRNV
jgi:hypothetical protein